MKFDKISLSCFDDIRYMLEFVLWLIFKKIVSQAVKRLKKIMIKRIAMIEKNCND